MEEDREKKERDTGRGIQENAGMDDKLIFSLRDLSHVMRALYEGKGSQRRTLIILAEIGRVITQRELTERLDIRPGSASEVISKLENAGYVKRIPSETDRRTSDIVLTEAGRWAAAEAQEQRTRRHEEMFSCLSDGEKIQLLSLLEKVNSDWKQRYHGVEEKGRGKGPFHRGHGHRRMKGD